MPSEIYGNTNTNTYSAKTFEKDNNQTKPFLPGSHQARVKKRPGAKCHFTNSASAMASHRNRGGEEEAGNVPGAPAPLLILSNPPIPPLSSLD